MTTLSIKSSKLLEIKIAAAIDQSELNDKIVFIHVDGDIGDVLAAVNAITDCEIDYAMSDYEGLDMLDIWGFVLPEDVDMLWRLNIRFSDDLDKKD